MDEILESQSIVGLAVQSIAAMRAEVAASLVQIVGCFALGSISLACGIIAAVTGKLYTPAEVIEKDGKWDLFFWVSTISAITFGILVLGVGLAILWEHFFG